MTKLKEKQAGEFLLRLINHFEAKGIAGSAVHGYVKTVKGWLVFNGIEVKKKIKVNDFPVRYETERIPTKEELQRILDVADLRARVAISLIAFSGFRNQVMGDFMGKDGLRIGDLPEMEIGTKVEVAKTPTLVRVRRELSKTRNPYFTFAPEQTCQYLKNYLEARMKEGQKLTSDTPLITALRQFNPRSVGNFIRLPTSETLSGWDLDGACAPPRS
jgi:integrase